MPPLVDPTTRDVNTDLGFESTPEAPRSAATEARHCVGTKPDELQQTSLVL